MKALKMQIGSCVQDQVRGYNGEGHAYQLNKWGTKYSQSNKKWFVLKICARPQDLVPLKWQMAVSDRRHITLLIFQHIKRIRSWGWKQEVNDIIQQQWLIDWSVINFISCWSWVPVQQPYEQNRHETTTKHSAAVCDEERGIKITFALSLFCFC